jgi:hypothetical protein
MSGATSSRDSPAGTATARGLWRAWPKYACAVVALIWLATYWNVVWASPSGAFLLALSKGCVQAGRAYAPFTFRGPSVRMEERLFTWDGGFRCWVCRFQGLQTNWWPRRDVQRDRRGTLLATRIDVPLYIPLAICLLLVGRGRLALWRRSRREQRGLCPECSYDLRGSPERCPECGSVVTEATPTKTRGALAASTPNEPTAGRTAGP